MPEKLTPLKQWSEDVGLGYQRAYRLARLGEIRAVQLGQRWYVIDDGLPDREDDYQDSPEGTDQREAS